MDGGSSLFKLPAPSAGATERALVREQALLIASSLAGMGVRAANAGRHDLAQGVEFLSEVRAKSKLPLVSANLSLADGSKPFPASLSFEADGRRVVAFGLTRPEPNLDPRLGVVVGDPVEAAREFVAKAGADDVLLCLTDLGYDEEHELARRVPRINLIVGGGEGTKNLPSPIPIGTAILLRSADRGRELGVLDLDLPAAGWSKPVNSATASQTSRGLETLRRDAPGLSGALMLDLAEEARKLETATGPSFRNSILPLGSEVGDDPAIARAAAEFQKRAAAAPQAKRVSSPRTPAPPPQKKETPPPRAKSAPPAGPDSQGGTLSCANCHREAYSKWLKSGHSASLARLAAKDRADPKCLGCHAARVAVGKRETVEPMVGCERCHGPGANHPSKAKAARAVAAGVCLGCHRGEHGRKDFDYAKGVEAVRCDR